MSDALDNLRADIPKLESILISTAPEGKKEWAKAEIKRIQDEIKKLSAKEEKEEVKTAPKAVASTKKSPPKRPSKKSGGSKKKGGRKKGKR